MTLSRPAEALRPNRVPCGPRRTSTRSISPSSDRPTPVRLRYTPSMNSATEDSSPGFSPTVPIPRMRAVKLDSLVAPETISEGASWFSARKSVTPEFLSASPPMAEIATGTSESSCSRRVAVTMIAPASAVSASDCGGETAAGVPVWAIADSLKVARNPLAITDTPQSSEDVIFMIPLPRARRTFRFAHLALGGYMLVDPAFNFVPTKRPPRGKLSDHLWQTSNSKFA